MDINENIWIEIALDDLKSAKLLYGAKQFRTSYFLFQQASEKANKAFALLAGEMTTEQLNDIKHNQFRIYRKRLVKHEAKIKTLIDVIEPFNHTRSHEVLNKDVLVSHKDSLHEGLSFIDGIKDRDLVGISLEELNKLYKQILNLEKAKIKMPKSFDKQLRRMWLKIADWIGGFETQEARDIKEQFLKTLEDEAFAKEFEGIIVKWMQVMIDIAVIQQTLYICALLTIQHSSLTRYPEAGKNPMQIYSNKLPLVKKQPFFMDKLEEALTKMSRLFNS